MNGRILIVEDESAVGSIIERALHAAGFRVIGVVPSVAAAMAAAEADRPDMAMVDVVLEDGLDGIALAGQLRSRWGIPFVYVTGLSDDETIERLKVTEPLGYVVKPFDVAQLVATVKVAFHRIERDREREAEAEKARTRTGELERGLSRIADLVRQTGTSEAGELVPPRVVQPLDVPGLSKREIEVLRLLLAARRVPAIARELGVSAHTVRNHLKAVFRKTGVHSQTELIDRFDPGRQR